MPWCTGKLLFVLSFLFNFSIATIDMNIAEFQYLADHLTEKECLDLVSSLHFHAFELPKDLIAAERRLPEDVPCIDLLLHWNSTPREGRGQTHVEISHRLNQIGREDLAQWLSKTVFHELSKDLKVPLTAETEQTTVSFRPTMREIPTTAVPDEAAWWKIDSVMEAFIFCGAGILIIGTIILICLCCSRKYASLKKEYEELSSDDLYDE